MESNVNIGLFTRNISYFVPTSNVDEDVIFRDDPKPIDDFVLPSFTMKVDSDADDALMMKGQFKKLNQKVDSILNHIVGLLF